MVEVDAIDPLETNRKTSNDVDNGVLNAAGGLGQGSDKHGEKEDEGSKQDSNGKNSANSSRKGNSSAGREEGCKESKDKDENTASADPKSVPTDLRRADQRKMPPSGTSNT